MKKRLLFKLKQLKSSFERYGLLRMPVLLLLFLFCMAQSYGQVDISGTVVDETGQPLIGVSVKVKGTNVGTVTNIDGAYNIQVPGTSSVLQFSYVSYLNEEREVGTQTKIDLTLTPDVTLIDEVVVVGYGTQKKSDLTGSIASVSSDELTQNKSLGFDQALQGKVAGVQISSTTGMPGSGTTIRVRGQTSINMSGGAALFIVDGVGMGNINSIPPEDIESIEILKDASSAAIYGVSGGNGVVLITTKKGKAGKTNVNFDVYYGMQSVPESAKADLMDGKQFAKTVNDMRHMSGRPDFYDETEMANMPNTDWQDQIFQKGPVESVSLSASGGSEKSTGLLSLNYMNQEGVLTKCRFERFTVRVNTEFKPTKWFEFGENLSVVTTTRRGFYDWQLHNEYNSPISQAIWFQPNIEPYRYDSTQEKYIWNLSEWGNLENPLIFTDLNHQKSNYYQGYGNAFARVNFTKWFRFDTRVGGEYNTTNTKAYQPSYLINSSHQRSMNTLNQQWDYYKSWNFQGYFTFQKTFLGSHNVTAVGGIEAFSSWQESMNLYGDSLVNTNYTQQFFDKTRHEDITLPNGAPLEKKKNSMFFRLNYDYKGKYLLTSNLRYDRSSVFGYNLRSDWFPAFSLGWKFSEEPFIKNLNIFSFGKIRFGWGEGGNDDIRSGAYTAMISNPNVYSYSFNNSTNLLGYGPMNGSNPDVHWEAIQQTNLGVDLGFLRGKLNVTVDWFKKKNVGMLLAAQPPAVAGQYIENAGQEGNPFYTVVNIGNLENSGLEFSVGYKNVAGKLSYDVSANLTYIKTLVGDIDGNVYYGNAHKGMGSYLNYIEEGHAIAEFYAYEADGIFTYDDATFQDADGNGELDGESEWLVTNQPYWVDDSTGARHYAQPNAKPGDIKFIDNNHNDSIDVGDMAYIGNPNPDFFAGLNINLSYSIIDLKILVQGVFGNQIYNTMKIQGYNNSAAFNWQTDFLDRFRDTAYDRYGNIVDNGNINGTIMHMDQLNANDNYRNSSYFMEDGWYIRMKDLQIGINMPQVVMNAIKFNKCRLYGGVQNLFTITDYTGLDPEVASGNPSNTDMRTKGIDIGTYPMTRTWYFGLQLGF